MEAVGGEKWKEQSEQLRGRPFASTQQSLVSGVIWSFISREARSACRDRDRIPCPDPAEHRQEGDISPPLTLPDLKRGKDKELKVWERKQTDNKGLGPQS